MANDKEKTFMIEGAHLVFRNFAGKADKYNREGDRNVSVLLDDQTAMAMGEDGWNVKYLDPREDGEAAQAYIQIAISYKFKAPHVVLVTSKTRTILDEDTIDILDSSDFENVDLIARGYEWEVNEKTGIKAYLKTMYATIEEDELMRKYSAGPIVGGE